MTLENKILNHLYYVSSTPRKGLKLALPEENYQSLMRAYRGACEKGYIEKYTEKNICRIRITAKGKKKLKESGIPLDAKKRKKATLKTDKRYQERMERVETAINTMKSAGVQTGKFQDFLDGKLSLEDNRFYTSSDIAAAIKQKKIRGEEVTKNESRYVGILTAGGKMVLVYSTLGKLMRVREGVERERQQGLLRVIKEITGVDAQVRIVVIGRSAMVLPKIMTGDKYGRNTPEREANGYLKENLLTYEVLNKLSPHSYYVTSDSNGIQELKRLIKFGFEENRIDEVKRLWLERYVPDATAVRSRFTVEGYLGDDEYIAIMPVIHLGYLNSLKHSNHRVTVVCNKGRQNSISKVLGAKMEKALSILDGERMGFVGYTDSGERQDGKKPFQKKSDDINE